MKDTKQVIVVRKDLKMRRGKEVAQGSHASMAFLTKILRKAQETKKPPEITEAQKAWLEASFAKVCLQVNSEKELLEIYQKALDAKLEAHLITDSGRTEFDGVPTKTCIAIGPDYVEKIDKITGHLTLY